MAYDPQNIFAKILQGQIPCARVYEDDYALAFHDIHPKAPIHVLIIPKGGYLNAYDFHQRASPLEITGYYTAMNRTLETLGLADDRGYRLISNTGVHGGQEVPHYHTHILGGGPLGSMISLTK
jgi:histidine triad (HIT) family protein